MIVIIIFLSTTINKVQHSFIAISCNKEVCIRFKNLTISPELTLF